MAKVAWNKGKEWSDWLSPEMQSKILSNLKGDRRKIIAINPNTGRWSCFDDSVRAIKLLKKDRCMASNLRRCARLNAQPNRRKLHKAFRVYWFWENDYELYKDLIV